MMSFIDMLEKAKLKNEKLNVNGILVYDKKEFLQIIEGEDSAIDSLVDSILKDSRHRDIKTIFDGAVQEKRYPRWFMKYFDAVTLKQIGVLNDFSPRYMSVDDVIAVFDKLNA